jgi:hypothetical protein
MTGGQSPKFRNSWKLELGNLGECPSSIRRKRGTVTKIP